MYNISQKSWRINLCYFPCLAFDCNKLFDCLAIWLLLLISNDLENCWGEVHLKYWRYIPLKMRDCWKQKNQTLQWINTPRVSLYRLGFVDFTGTIQLNKNSSSTGLRPIVNDTIKGIFLLHKCNDGLNILKINVKCS